ncbi:MAG: 2-C-methyl-D-erythritol 4-phosphate cytidylyltransferase [Nitrospirae bacterium]|nr:2-C-methyl-D-erythritol 4-phosphate cytidylyltransferase [Nitrospirota bacterium]
MKKTIAIVPAAGLGKRFGQDNNKTFQALLDKPIVIWALEALECVDDIEEIIPVFKKDDMEQGLALIERFRISKVKRVAPGGKERQDSVFNGLNLIGKKAAVVLIHDGVRPLIEKSVIEESIKQLKDSDGVIVGVPVKDTIKKVSSEIFVQKTLDRKTLWVVQTPQVFKYGALMQAYKKAMAEKFYSTDDSAIVERYGGKVKVIMGSYTNIKVTTPEDLDMAEMFLRKRAI